MYVDIYVNLLTIQCPYVLPVLRKYFSGYFHIFSTFHDPKNTETIIGTYPVSVCLQYESILIRQIMSAATGSMFFQTIYVCYEYRVDS